jgi:pyruvate-formate lyase-activating enzyme
MRQALIRCPVLLMPRTHTNYNQRRSGTAHTKHLLALRDYATPRKLLNLAQCELEKRCRIVNGRALPYTATIDVTNACNLRCPGCPTGAGLVGRRKTMLDLQQLQRFLDELGSYLIIAYLYNWGESLLHPRAHEIVELVHARRIFTSISSNLNVRNFETIEAICDAGLDHLMISADGATPATYGKYRIGGSFELVVDNIRRIVEYRNRTGRSRPILEWQVLAFNYLEAELQEVERLAAQLGVDWFRVKGPTAPDGLQPAAEPLKGRFYGGQQACGQLWHNVVLQADGGVAPCCNVYYQSDDFGHLDQQTVAEVRSGARYRLARELFDGRTAPDIASDPKHPCLRCPIVHRQAHLKEVLQRNGQTQVAPGFMAILEGTADETEVTERWLRGHEPGD